MEGEESGWPDQQPPSIYCVSPPQPCYFFNVPIEIRNKIYRYFVSSRLDCRSHPRLWRPLCVDAGISRKIGYFDKETVLLIFLVYMPVPSYVSCTILV